MSVTGLRTLLTISLALAAVGCAAPRGSAGDQSREILRAALLDRIAARSSLRSIGTFRLDTLAVDAEWGASGEGEQTALLSFAYDGNRRGSPLPAAVSEGVEVVRGTRESAHACEGLECRLVETGYFLQLTLPRASRDSAAVGYIERWPEIAQTGTLHLARRGNAWVVVRNSLGASAH